MPKGRPSAWGAERSVSSAAEIAAATRLAKPGDVIVMRDGVWKDADILFDCQGTDGKPITLRAQTPGKVILSGQSRLRIAGAYLVVDGARFYLAVRRRASPRGDLQKYARSCRIR